MKFAPGKVIDKAVINGKEVIFRYPKMSDVDGMLKYINRLTKEGAPIAMQMRVSKKEEEKYLKGCIKKLKSGSSVKICVIVDGKFCGSCDIDKSNMDATAHVSSLGISLSKEVRGLGIGTRLMELLIEHARKQFKAKIIRLDVYSYNKIAQGLYKKTGFVAAGKIPKGCRTKDGKYYDDIIMVKKL